jgi:hypothetical protein
MVVALTSGGVVWSLRRHRAVSTPMWCLFAGSLLGAVAMFSNGAYRRALSGDNGYQKIGQAAGSRTDQMLTSLDTIIGPYGVTLNTALNVVLLALLAVVATGRVRDSRGPVRLAFGAVGGVALVAAGLILWLVPRKASELTSTGIVSLLLLLLTLGVAAVTVPDRSARRLLLFVTASFVVLVAPLLVVKPLGPRCFVPSYALLLVAVAVLAHQGVRRMGSVSSGLLIVAAAAIAVPTFVSHYAIYHKIDQASAVRQAQARAAAAEGATTVVLKHLPGGSRWVHAPDPASEPWETRYKLFYHLPRTLKITVK